MISQLSFLWQSPFFILALVLLLYFTLILFLAVSSAVYSIIREKQHKKGLAKYPARKTQLPHNKELLNNTSTPHSGHTQAFEYTHSFQYDTYHFYQKKNFMTNRERYFFKLVHNEFYQDFFVFSQVRMVDIITPVFDKETQYNSFIKAFRSISQYHIDFLIVDKSNFSIVCAIELDDSSHDLPDRIKRDNKINMIFKFTGIPLLRSRDSTELLNKIRYYIQYHNFN
ncbi:DUF2726 domain-containing protein [Escherichia marmotae]|uniref:DUF2726 domain-containing protein n=1 Tax=Escherichia TaxID=561 RepID=UPI00098C564E|nr:MULTISPECIES: DUF2726 domain-containing protein [Escherichia]EFF0514527.1 DUF2726 domain-containing protein [Escherichia coli]EFG1925444.1 DUF2726 domain-containing protein [Escherichia coli]EFJ3037466.1 DUF2726 domain-containing protein [Escherichia coli]EGM8700644.1 DUF2726 domain-containing protein [Escherichia coli]EJS0691310.1 DUF2726 domain-containing protein [Escherichia coli]